MSKRKSYPLPPSLTETTKRLRRSTIDLFDTRGNFICKVKTGDTLHNVLERICRSGHHTTTLIYRYSDFSIMNSSDIACESDGYYLIAD